MEEVQLDQRILEGMQEKGIVELTPIQKKAIPKILEGKNLLIIAPTGSGKTEAALLPIFHRILHEGGMALYLAPLRALDRDMLKRFKEYWSEKLGINVAMRHGDTPVKERAKQAKEKIDLLITTPETLQNLFRGRNLRKHLFRVKYVVVDEVHELLGSDRGLQLSIALERLEEYSPGFQRIGLSATIKNEEEALKFLIGNGRKGEIVKWYPKVPFEAKVSVVKGKKEMVSRIKSAVSKVKSALIFTNTREEAEEIGHLLGEWDRDLISVHHGSLSKGVRESVEGMLKEGRIKGVVCTSSLELGIDVGHIEYVIQIGSPRQVIKFVQRIGRSGHKLTSRPRGEIIVDNSIEAIESSAILDLAYSGWFEEARIRENALSPLANQIIGYAIENFGKFSPEHFYKIVKRAYPYRNLDKNIYERLVEFLVEIGLLRKYQGEYRASRKAYQYFNENVSMIPDEEKYLAVDLSGKMIGLLDSDFVGEIDRGEPLVLHGKLWKVEEIDEEKKKIKLSLAGSKDLTKIPHWYGENLPVSYRVAMRAYHSLYSGKIRWDLIKFFQGTGKIREKIKKLSKEIRSLLSGFDEMLVEIVLPEDWEGPLLYQGRGMIYIHSPFGHKVNAALASILSAYLSERLGITNSPDWTAYSVILYVPSTYGEEYLKELAKNFMFKFNPEDAMEVVKENLIGVASFRKVLYNVAQKMGIKLRSMSKKTIQGIMYTFYNSPLFLEAFHKFEYEKANFSLAMKVIEGVQSGKIEIKVIRGPTEFCRTVISKASGLNRIEERKASSLQVLRQKLDSREMYYVCLSCGYSRKVTPAEILEEGPMLSCPLCNSVLIGLSKREIDLRKASRKEIQELRKTHEILKTWGYLGALTLAASGIGPTTAIRILRESGNVLEDLLRKIEEAEKRYFRTREFWKFKE